MLGQPFGLTTLEQDEDRSENTSNHEPVILRNSQVYRCAHANESPKQRDNEQITRDWLCCPEQYPESENSRWAWGDTEHRRPGIRVAETDTKKGVNYHCVKNEASPDYWQQFQVELKGQPQENCAHQEKEYSLKYIENSENLRCRIDNAEIE